MYALAVVKPSDGAVTIFAVGIVQAIVGTGKIAIVESSKTRRGILQQIQDVDAVADPLVCVSVTRRSISHQSKDVDAVADPLAETSVATCKTR